MLGQIQPTDNKIYLNIKDGAVVRRTSSGEEKYGYVEGQIAGLYQKDRTFRGETSKYWYIDLRDPQSLETYSIGFSYSSNVFKSIVLSLASDDGLNAATMVRIEPYLKNGYDKVVVWSEGVKLDWIVKSLPPVKDLNVGGRVIKDDSERMAVICSYASQIVNRITNKIVK